MFESVRSFRNKTQLEITCNTFSKNLLKACRRHKDISDTIFTEIIRTSVLPDNFISGNINSERKRSVPTHNLQWQVHACEELKFLSVNE